MKRTQRRYNNNYYVEGEYRNLTPQHGIEPGKDARIRVRATSAAYLEDVSSDLSYKRRRVRVWGTQVAVLFP